MTTRYSYKLPVYSCNTLMKLELSRQIFEKYLDIKFNGNPYSGSRVVPCWWTVGRTDVTKLIVTFRSFFLMRVKVSLFFHPVISARDKGEWSIRWTPSAEVENTLLRFLHSLVSNHAYLLYLCVFCHHINL